MAHSNTCTVEVDSVIRGKHEYKDNWHHTEGQILHCHEDLREEAQLHDKFAVGVYIWTDRQEEQLVGHVPREISGPINKFLSITGSKFSAVVTGHRRPDAKGKEKGLVVPARFKATSTHLKSRKIIDTLKDEISTIIAKDPKFTLQFVM